MANANSRQRQRNQSVWRRLAAAVQIDVRAVAEEEGVYLPPDREAALVRRLVNLADPYAYEGIDAPLPADRWDLRREFCRRVLSGQIRTEREIEQHARELAPIPGDPVPPGPGRSWGSLMPSVTYNQAAQAFADRRRRRPRSTGAPAMN